MNVSTVRRTDIKSALSGSTMKIIANIVYFLCGILAANSTVFEKYAPFGISLAASVPFNNILFAIIGSAIGYMIHGGYHFRYVAAMLAVLAIRWTLKDIKKLQRYSLYNILVCIVPTAATSIAVMTVNGYKDIFMYILEIILAGMGAYFISRTINIINGTKTLGTLLPQEISALILTGCIALSGISSITIGSLSLGRILAGICILIAAHYGGVAGGCISGISTGIILGISASDYYFLGTSYAFGGLLAGLFSPTGRILSAVMFIFGSGIASLQASSLSTVIQTLYELTISSLIFMLIPKNAFNFITAVFSLKKSDKNYESLRRSVIMRLDFASKALSGVSNDVDEVSKRLSTVVTPTLESVYQKAVESTCVRCGMKTFCWEHRNGVSLELFDSVTKKLRHKGEIEAKDFCDELKRKCCRSIEMASAVNKSYKNYLLSEAAAKRIDEIRTVVAGQFCGLGDILGEMADEYENYEFFDNELAEKILVRFKDLGMIPIDVNCRVNYMGRMTVEAEIFDGDRSKIKRNVIVSEISKICGRIFDTPNITAAFGRCRIILCEKAILNIEIAASQHISDCGQLCGDNFSYFYDGMGRFITVLSDGMGTGGRAAVDGRMAVSIMSKLIKAGLGFECSLKVVNSALMVKSEDESLATLDILSIDLYNGETDFFKAGAALSFVRKGTQTYRIETPSLPVGILPDVKFTDTEDNFTRNDIIIMLSDGAVVTGDDWIEHILDSSENKSMQELADTINDEAVSRRNDGHDDDITVIAVKIL